MDGCTVSLPILLYFDNLLATKHNRQCKRAGRWLHCNLQENKTWTRTPGHC